MDQLVLGRALTVVLRLLIDDMHERLAAEGFDDLRPAYGYVLNAAAGNDVTASGIGAILGMTKQGAAKLLSEMAAAGYVTRQRSPDDARARPVVLTSRGRAALAAAERIQQAIEAEWSRLTSPGDLAALRRLVDAVLADRSPDGVPPLRPVW